VRGSPSRDGLLTLSLTDSDIMKLSFNVKTLTYLGLVIFVSLKADSVSYTDVQEMQENLVKMQGVKVEASSFFGDGWEPIKAVDGDPDTEWAARGEIEGAWIKISFPKPVEVEQLRISPRRIGPEVELAKEVVVTFSDGSTKDIHLEKSRSMKIVTMPDKVKTQSIQFTIRKTWGEPVSGLQTGLCEIEVYSSKPDKVNFQIRALPSYSGKNEKPVQEVVLIFENPGDAIDKAELVIKSDSESKVAVDSIPAQYVTEKRVWIPYLDLSKDIQVDLVSSGKIIDSAKLIALQHDFYFKQGTCVIIPTCHNDLGWADTPKVTADLRERAMITPALELMAKNPDFCWTMESTAYLEEYLERKPDRLEEIRKRVKEGRLEWGGSYVQMLQSHVGPENIARQFYFGRKWLKKLLGDGCDTHIFWNIDVPSMGLQMPQILAKSGIKYAIMGRVPYGFYRWESPDGSSVLVHSFSSHGSYANDWQVFKQYETVLGHAHSKEDYYRALGLPPHYAFVYAYDYSPPEPRLIGEVSQTNKNLKDFSEAYRKEHGKDIVMPKVEFSTGEKFMKKMEEGRDKAQLIRGEWPLHWAYYDEPSNREALLTGRGGHNLLQTAETFHTLYTILNPKADYPASTLQTGWQANVWPDHGWGGNKGTITDKEYWDSYQKSYLIGRAQTADAIMKLSQLIKIDKDRKGVPLVVFNPVAWSRSDIVFCPKPDIGREFKLVDDQNHEVPYQWVKDNLPSHLDPKAEAFAFLTQDLPSHGYRVYFLLPEKASEKTRVSWDEKKKVVNTQRFEITLGGGGIERLIDLGMKKEIIKNDKFVAGELLNFHSDPAYAWACDQWVSLKDFERGRTCKTDIYELENGPVRCVIRQETNFSKFTFYVDVIAYPGLGRVDISCWLKWPGTKARELRLALPLNIPEAKIRYQVPFGSVLLGIDDVQKLPINITPYQAAELPEKTLWKEVINWVDISNAELGCTIATDTTVFIFTDQTSDPLKTPLVQPVLLATKKSLGWNPEYYFTQEGDHRYRFSLIPHGANRSDAQFQAIAHNYPIHAVYPSSFSSSANLPTKGSFFSIEPSNLVVTSLKKAEDDDSLVVRFYEAEGNDTKATLRFFRPIAKAELVNLIEEDGKPLEVSSDGSLTLSLGHHSITTVKVHLAK